MATASSGGDTVVDDDTRVADDFLTFGDSVSFLDGERRGFMAAGISSSLHSCLSVRPSDDARVDPKLGNFQSAVFQIHAHNKYRASKRLTEMVRPTPRPRNPGLAALAVP